jgi:crotonobetainyl-CoA:carnitine CoA-transferase CaiB-like acyl-CoA transferase
MEEASTQPGRLLDCRVLDLTDHRGKFAGDLLENLGADVRRLPASSTDDGVLSAASQADILIESGATAIDLEAIRRANPALITVSISAFGQTGPKADWAATDLTLSAACGLMALLGDADRPPLRMAYDQSWRHASASAAVGALVALRERSASGAGQHIDVSAQEALMIATQHNMLSSFGGGRTPNRIAGGQDLGEYTLRYVYECADGYAICAFMTSVLGGFSNRMCEWIRESEPDPAPVLMLDWTQWGYEFTEQAQNDLAAGQEQVAAFLKTKTRQEILEAADSRRLLLAPVHELEDVLAFDQLAARGLWGVGVRDGMQIVTPRSIALETACEPPTDFAAMPEREFGELDEQPSGPLKGVRIVDFSWAIAAPLATRAMADFGATVIRVESAKKPDVIRSAFPWRGQVGDREGSFQWHTTNAGKYSLAVDLATEKGRAIVLDLVRWADVVVGSFAPGVLRKLGLDYIALRAVNPDLIMIESSILGHSGPRARMAGVGIVGAALAGFTNTVGWPDRAPAGPWMAYTDYTAAPLTAALLLAALERKHRTGAGGHFDLSQVEAGVHFLAEALAEYQTTGRKRTRRGNDEEGVFPHGVFPCADAAGWMAIAVESDDQWRALAERCGLAAMASFGLAERLAARHEIDGALGSWTRGQDADELEALLQSLGIAAHRVNDSLCCQMDAQLAARNHFLRVPHEKHGYSFVEGTAAHLSRTPARTRWAGPTTGQHTHDVLRKILRLSDEEIFELEVADVLE